MTEAAEKKPSKKELKRLAKSAKKQAKKGGGKAAGKEDQDKDTKTVTRVTNNEAVYFLAGASKEDNASSLKASIAASSFGVKLARASTTFKLPSIFSGPALFHGNNPSAVAFGGNGTAKAISLIGTQSTSNFALIDQWLELERTSLRKYASGQSKNDALKKIDQALATNGGSFLVGNHVTVADIAIVVTLSQQSEEYSKSLQHYIRAHLESAAFVHGIEALDKLVPPPPFDIENDPSVMGAVNSIFYAAIAEVVPDIAHTLSQVIEKSKVLKNGDYQCKEAMPLFARLKATGSLPAGINSPQQVANAIVDKIPEDNPVVDSIVVNGPGFILCRVKASYLEHHVNVLMNSSQDGTDPSLPLPKKLSNQNDVVVVDFSSPNIAKEMHVGHLRSTIIGESVCRILEFVGADVKRVNHVGDWGTQFGMLITFLKESFPNFGNGDDNVDIGDLTQFYKKAKVSYRKCLVSRRKLTNA